MFGCYQLELELILSPERFLLEATIWKFYLYN